jgi:chaperonin cofactor prefoldin
MECGKKMSFIFVLLLCCICPSISADVSGKEVPFTLEDRDRLIRVEAKLAEIDKRFEQIDKRFEQVDKRFEQIDKRLEQMMSFIWILAVIFSGLTASTIGFALWDRRTMIRPFEVRVKEIERMRGVDADKLERLLEALREMAKKNIELYEVLKKFNLL